MSNEESSNFVTDFLKTEQTTKKISRITLTARTYLNMYIRQEDYIYTRQIYFSYLLFYFTSVRIKTECECKRHLL